jgi:nucleoside-diphosphate-sugar epimerase
VRVLVTGAGGFVGRAACRRMSEEGWTVRAGSRSATAEVGAQERAVVGAASSEAEWAQAVKGVDAVLHLAARAHVLKETEPDPARAYREANTAATIRAAQAAAAAGVRRFVFMSTVGVHGRPGDPTPLTENSPANPEDDYSRSKWEAEQGLIDLGRRTGMEIAILRSPLIYGPGNPGNFLRLLRWVDRGVPLPFGRVRNRRSLVGVANAADALVALVRHPAAAGGTYLVSDGEDLSTPDLVRAIGEALQRPANLIGVPPGLLRAGAWLLGRRRDAERLMGSLVVDSSKLRRELSWSPPVPLAQGLRSTADWYRSQVPN